MDIKNLEILSKFCEKERIPTALPTQTNEEWMNSLSTKKRAEWLFKITYKCYWCGREYTPRGLSLYNEKECPFKKCMKDKKDFEKWLKEEHHADAAD